MKQEKQEQEQEHDKCKTMVQHDFITRMKPK